MRKLETYLRMDPPRVSSEPTASSYSSTLEINELNMSLKLVILWDRTVNVQYISTIPVQTLPSQRLT